MSDSLNFDVGGHLLGLRMPSVFQGDEAFFSFPAPCTVAPNAWQKQAQIIQTHALHDQRIKYLSPSESQMWLWNVMAHLSGGRLPPCLLYQHAESFTTPSAPPGCHEDLLHCLANSALWLYQGISCSFYRHGFSREISANLLLSLLGRFCSYCWSQAAGAVLVPCFHSKIRMSPWDAVTAAEHHAGLLSAHCRWRASLHREAPPAYLRISAITLVQASLIKPDALMWA